jgi:integrase/recombinase XerD
VTTPRTVIDAEIVPLDASSGGAVALRPDLAVRDALALAWVESYDTDSPNTAERYARDVPGWTFKSGAIVRADPRAPGSFFGWADDNGYDVAAVLPWHVEQYIRYLSTAEHLGRYTRTRRLSKSTIAGKVAAVSSFYKYAARQSRDRIIHNPVTAARRPKPSPESSTRGLDKAEVDKMLAAAQQEGRREYALLLLLATAGLRASEVCKMDTSDLMRDSGEWVVRVVRKGAAGDTTNVPIPDVTARALRRHMRGRRGPMFQRHDGQRMTRQALAYTVGVLARRAFPKRHPNDPDPAAGITPHVFRHTCTTLLLNRGVTIQDVQALMDHASISTTERYDRANRKRNNPAVAVLGEMFEDGFPDVEA